jgi:hypothetical protein
MHPTVRFTRLPNGFTYPASRRRVLEFVAATEVNFSYVTFAGISPSLRRGSPKLRRTKGLWLASLDLSQFEDADAIARHLFSITLYGIREQSHAIPRAAEALFDAANKWLAEKRAETPERAPLQGRVAHVLLVLNEETGAVLPHTVR